MANRKQHNNKNDIKRRTMQNQNQAEQARERELEERYARVLRAHQQQRGMEGKDAGQRHDREKTQQNAMQRHVPLRNGNAGRMQENQRPQNQQNAEQRANAQKGSKVIRIRRRIPINVGIALFVLVCFYTVFSVFSYMNRKQVKFYEVEKGNIVRENSYTGIILRDEQVMNSPEGGYLNYYIPEGRKAAKNTRVYSIDESGKLKEYLQTHADELNELSKDNEAEIRSTLDAFSRQYSDVSFQSLYDMDAALNAQVLEYASMNVLSDMAEELQNAGVHFTEHAAGATGMVSYIIDGYEGKTPESLTEADFDQTAYKREVIQSGDLVAAGGPCYKLITSDNWSIVFPLDETDIAAIGNQENLKIRLSEQNITVTAPFQILRGADGNSYGKLDLTRYLALFASDRFIRFEVVTNDVSGLKIPEKSVTNKDFYIIPLNYLAQDEAGNEGFYKETLSDSGTSLQFIITDIFNKDDSYAYIDCGENMPFQPGDYVSEKDSPGTRYQIGPTKPVEGVYNINKGYTVFKRIELLETANGYCIIKDNSSYGLSVYDHIVLDAATIGDGQLIYR